jgi:hypothetical protein
MHVMRNLLNRHIAFPGDHGSWVFLLSPLLIGLYAGGSWVAEDAYLVIGALAAFLLRQPAAMLVKMLGGRRSRKDLPAAALWLAIYGGIALICVIMLVRAGHAYLLYLALPGVLVFGWHLLLVYRREERNQMGIDIIASGALALAAPGAYWLGTGGYVSFGWWLWVLTWLQSAASIVYAFLRLAQRRRQEMPDLNGRLQMAWRALLYSGFNLLLVSGLTATGILSAWIWLPYLLQMAETVWGTLYPAIGWKPTRIGLRQLVVSVLFTILFILVW